MKKTFPLQQPGKADARVLDAIKHDVRKYVKRERKKTPAAGFTQWEFSCKVGPDAASATAVPLDDISAAIDEAAQAGGPSIYVEVIANPAGPAPA